MAQRTRAYFFDSPFTSAGVKFNPNNIPTKNTFADLLDSVCFKTESGDLATTTQQGVVLLATTAVSKARAGAGVVVPAQLPVMTYGASNTELVTPGSQSYQGIKVTAVDKTYRLDYQFDFDPTSLTAKATIATTDFVTIVDVADSNKPKKALASLLLGSSLFTRTSTTLTPTNAGDDLDMSGGDVTADSLLLKAATNTYINPLQYTGNNGASLTVSGGAGQHASASKVGGALYLLGGAGVNGGAYGNIYLGWDGTYANGNIAVRGVPHAGYEFTVHDDAYFDGSVYIKPTAPPGGGVTINNSLIHGSDGNVYYLSFKDFMTQVLGGTVPSGDSILLYASSAYSKIAIGSTKDAFLHTNASTGALEMATLNMTNRVTDSSVVSITPAKIIGATGANDVVAVFDKTTGALKLGTYKADNLGVAKILSKTILITSTDYTSIPSQLPNSIIIDTTAGENDVTLPDPANVADGFVVEFLQWGANLGKIVGAITNGHGGTATSYSLPGINTGLKVYADHALFSWVIAAYYPAP